MGQQRGSRVGSRRDGSLPVRLGSAVLLSAALFAAWHDAGAQNTSSASSASWDASPAPGVSSAQAERTRREAAVPDETADAAHPAAVSSAASASSSSPNPPTATARAAPRTDPPLPSPYGPVLNPRDPAGTPPATAAPRRDPAEVRDETDGGQPRQPQAQAAPGRPPERATERRSAPRRRPAWQVVEPPTPSANAARAPVPVPAAPSAPRPVLPSSSISGGCQGGLCRDASGNTTTGTSPARIGDGGRLCVQGTATVQCF